MSGALGKILIVDDEKEICDVLGDFFLSQGYEVEKAFNGIDALDRFEKERPDLVLLDIRMPGLDGVEVLRRIREIDPAAGVIMITANEDMELAKKLLGMGAADYVRKPFDFGYLDRAVFTRIMEGRKEAASAPSSPGDHGAEDKVYALTLGIFSAVRALADDARASVGKRLESAAWSASARLLAQDHAGVLAALAEVELLLWLARDLEDMKESVFEEIEGQLQAAREALGGSA